MKKTKMGFSDGMIYFGLCLLTLGGAWFLRIIITHGIRKAFDDQCVHNGE